jgi:hypothetical protein
VTEWPVERQRQALTDAGFSGPIFEDTLTRHQLRGRNTAALTARADMLRPTPRQSPELILVPSIRVLALSPVDLTAALAAAACAAWDKARRADQTRDARGKGNKAMIAAAERRRKAALAIARPLWGLPSENEYFDAINASQGEYDRLSV